jgi:hypothetical protein
LHYADIAEVALSAARDSATKDQTQRTYDQASLIYGAEISAAGELKKVDSLASGLLKSAPQRRDEIEALQKEAKKAGESIGKAKESVDKVVGVLPRDPPIDSLSHSVKFVVAVSGNVSPNWALVHFRGPAPTNTPLFSAAHSRTHTLSIAMGSPSAPEEQVRALNNLVIIQNLRPAP